MLPALAGDCLEIKFDGSTPGMVIIDGGMGKECRAILKKDPDNEEHWWRKG